ncbi:MAG: hypothetical protein GY861_28715 [bacterium]|nr:hypothetical protein [bacterium]
MNEQQALKMMKESLDDLKVLEKFMDIELYHLFESLRMNVNGKIKI